MEEIYNPWEPLTVDEVATVFHQAPFRWWIAGGYALELALGKAIRNHADIDIGILRKDHVKARNWLGSWDCWAAEPPGSLREWLPESKLADSVHNIWCRQTPGGPWQMQLMLDEAKDDYWLSRRDSRIQVKLAGMIRISKSGIPFLAPHIQLYYKAKQIREKDQIDFDAILDSEMDIDKAWLQKAIVLSYGNNHPWLRRLKL